MGKSGVNGGTRLIHALGYSLQGLRAALRHEPAFRLEVVLFIVLFPFAWWLGQTLVQQLILIGAMVLVLVVELINSAIEAVVDRVGNEPHELAGRAKDMGSAAVLLSVGNVIFIWAMIAWQRFMG
ncbi:MAG: diacylglycerol kinase [Gammaproteobacteria bacterium]|nr:diacylglycerol kinase [Gammaproteobacteria bacterium]